MKDVMVKRDELLGILKKNLEIHKDLYASAAEAFRSKYVVEIDRMKQKSQANEFLMHVDLQKPENHSDDYEVAIRMLEMETRTEIELTDDEFAKFVLNKWRWITSFYSSFSSNTGYSGYTGISGYSGYSGISGYQYKPEEMKRYFGGV